MRSRNQWMTYIVLGLIALGILASIFRNPGAYIIPIVVFGIVFWLYKYPPNRWRGRSGSSSRAAKAKRRNGSFRVINGRQGQLG
ncbi:hypothetical protein LJK87_06765 [Paenibacillus sp. P25]|nr:hypothetical protein LJK87_06765 [Paenibacillus sp. P25]